MLQLQNTTNHYLCSSGKDLRSGWLAFIFFTSLYSVSFAQNGILTGKVKDGESVLQGATITVAQQSAVTNAAGEFSIAVKAGANSIIVTYVGCKMIEQTIIVNAGQTLFEEFNMVREDLLHNVVILGSHSFIERSNLNTTVPVDLVSSRALKQTAQFSLIQMLNFTAPSLSVSRENLFEPVTLRGLAPDHLLILLDGTRYHNTAYINGGSIKGTLGLGAVTNDLSSIPFSAIEKIEILKDGASAQYGSDAIAGVMNIVLKKTTGKFSTNLQLGQQYKGDGESAALGFNGGIHLNKRGFLNFSGDLRCRKPTHRGGEYLGTVYYSIPPTATPSVSAGIIQSDNQKILERGFSRKTPVSNDGSIALNSYGFLVNGGYAITRQIEWFWTGTANYRHPVYPGAYRFPKTTNQVNTALHPDGFMNKSILNTLDLTIRTGARGKTNGDWNWEWNSIYGKNGGMLYLKNTNNASQFAMGASAPTGFYAGSTNFIQQINTIGVSKDIAKVISSVKAFNIGFGAEYRFEKYRTREGEEGAWNNYDPSGRTQAGAVPLPGITPRDVVNENRSVAGTYVDLETDINDHFLVNMSGRYEYYKHFGNNLAGKLAVRYKLSSAFSIRGSVSNGYHAPALQQMYYSANTSGFSNVSGVNVPVQLGIFSNNSDVAEAFGVKVLRPEKAVNLSFGFTSAISPHVNITVDGYWVQVKDRITLSGIFDRGNPHVNSILKNRSEVDRVQFVTNAINTKTRGMDFVADGNWKIGKSLLQLTFAANFTQTNIFGPVQTADKLPAGSLNTNTLFNREEREKIEHGQPGSKILLSGSYRIKKMGFLLRNTRFGKTAAVLNSADKSQDEFFSAKVLTDISMEYMVTTWLNITAGINNVFDVYPDPLKNSVNKSQGILVYSNQASPFGYNGGYYFLGMAFNW